MRPFHHLALCIRLIEKSQDYDDVARRKYKKDIDGLKPDLKSYNAQRQAALGQGSSSSALPEHDDESESSALIKSQNSELLYRDANSFVYADHKPSEDAIDRVVQKINLDQDKRNKFSRARKEEGDVTYINEANKVSSLASKRWAPEALTPPMSILPRISTRSSTGLNWQLTCLNES